MKHLSLGIGILVVLLILCTVSMCMLDRTADQVASLLESAWSQAGGDDFQAAAGQMEKARSIWEDRHGMAASLVDHQKLEEIDQGFVDLQAWLTLEEEEEFIRGCMALAQQLRAMAEAEKLYYFNIL